MQPKRHLLSTLALSLALSSAFQAASGADPKRTDPAHKKQEEIENIVVTATRIEERLFEIPEQITLIQKEDIQRTVQADLADILKKDASLDVVQYTGALSGVGLRGFQPELFGAKRHHLLLIDGRPAGTSNLATIAEFNIERIEVLKGPASSLYGSQAMGGVINVITRKSHGQTKARAQVGYGSFQAYHGRFAAGGSATSWLSFDVGGGMDIQKENITMGNEKVREHTLFSKYFTSARLAAQISSQLMAEISTDYWAGRDIQSPGAEGSLSPMQGTKNIDRLGGDLKLSGDWEEHHLVATAFGSQETWTRLENPKKNDPYKSYESRVNHIGVQMQDTCRWDEHSFTLGFDLEKKKIESLSFKDTGQRQTPYTPDHENDTVGIYAGAGLWYLDSKLLLKGSLRWDYIGLKTLSTPYFDGHSPGSKNLNAINPSAGASYEIQPGFRVHSTLGRAFAAPTAYEIAGRSERVFFGVTSIEVGNPDLRPEKSWSWDAGLSLDMTDLGICFNSTFFITHVTDKIERQEVLKNQYTFENMTDANIRGIEVEFSVNTGRWLGWNQSLRLYANATHLFEANETNKQGVLQDIYNVAHTKVNYGIEYDDGTWINARLNARYRGKLKDQDWITLSGKEIQYPDWVVLDLVVNVKASSHHEISVQLGNLLDQYYYEKRGYALPGRTFFVKYAYLL
jgi:vitamin B12 transporter